MSYDYHVSFLCNINILCLQSMQVACFLPHRYEIGVYGILFLQVPKLIVIKLKLVNDLGELKHTYALRSLGTFNFGKQDIIGSNKYQVQSGVLNHVRIVQLHVNCHLYRYLRIYSF